MEEIEEKEIREKEKELLRKIFDKLNFEFDEENLVRNRKKLKTALFASKAEGSTSRYNPQKFDDIEGAHEYLRDLYGEIGGKKSEKNYKVYDEYIKEKKSKEEKEKEMKERKKKLEER